jgi:hypothetical protein
MGHAHVAPAFCHHTGKACFGAVVRQGFGQDNAGVIARQHDHAAQQVLDGDPVTGIQKHG